MEMAGRQFQPPAGNTVLLFGPQALSFDEEAFHHIRSTVRSSEKHAWILEVIAELPKWLSEIALALPHLQIGRETELLNDLISWFDTGKTVQDARLLPNIILNPLVIIGQLLDYSRYLQLITTDSTKGDNVFTSSRHGGETLGFCTGFLSALAVSSSLGQQQLQEYGAVAIRLGMLIGLVVDSLDRRPEVGTSTSLATVWHSPESAEQLLRILDGFPEAYVSVRYDENRATVTTSAKSASELQKQLRNAGIIATQVALRGRFHHHEGHKDDMASLLNFCDSHSEFQFPDASELVVPTRSNAGGDYLFQGPLHHTALRSILLEQPQWYQTFTAVSGAMLQNQESRVISFGPERCVPPSLMRTIGSQIVHLADVEQAGDDEEAPKGNVRPPADNDIAVVGMSIKVAGANNVEEFWQLLCDGKSQHKEVPEDRFDFDTVYRDNDKKRKWYGNFMDDHDKFDHKFFKKSPREIASTDPQQRHILQAAYQAVEQSGYFVSPQPDKRVGCYVGVCAVDYENNIACHAPNAFSATGNLKGFIAGKVSHYFGWTGPGLTIDTACSSSAVAVHQACKAILTGECDAALAGGTHVMTSPLCFQNLAGASFLSLTGQCKPFDAHADGYCRGEGVAAVFLKKMSAAIADGDQILGTIASTAVQQNQNCTPIFVPNSPSLSDLFVDVTHKAQLQTPQITVVEAHGTGTAVGDPVEYESVRRVLGGESRRTPVMLSSVKGLVGHLECTSGLVSLIKVLLMIRKGAVPPQASFQTMNPAIHASPTDNIIIPQSLQPWDVDFRAALINNYGASGSNASMVVTEAPRIPPPAVAAVSSEDCKQVFWLTGLDDKSLHAYAVTFRHFLGHNLELSLADLAFNVSRQSNRTLDRGLLLSCRSTTELGQKLDAFNRGESAVQAMNVPTSRPVILCFGGQTSTFVGLDRQLYEGITVFRNYLNECNSICISLGLSSIFPGIFQRTPLGDPLRLQTMLFALQYSCAKSWMDCGVRPVAVVGHSFGELTSLCISGVLSLLDALKMISVRAQIIKEAWGAEKGAMMAVEADLEDVKTLLAESNRTCIDSAPASIGCYNGPRSFTLSGSSKAIDAASETALKTTSVSPIKMKKLSVTNAFHSTLVDHLMSSLETQSHDLKFKSPSIPIERATEYDYKDDFTPRFVAEHMRNPVYFNQAVQRLSERYPSATWLEVGSNSTVTAMASRALASPKDSLFQSVNITSDNALDSLAETTLNLFKAGLRVSFWGHHHSQTNSYASLLLPPYQFDKARHWMELKKPPKPTAAEPVAPVKHQEEEKLPEGLLTFVGYQDSQSQRARFRVNTMIPKYEELIVGHVVASTAPICPATVQIDLAVEAVRSLRSDPASSGLEPQIHSVENQSPICPDSARLVWIDLEPVNGNSDNWQFSVTSTHSQKHAATTTHTVGKIMFHSADDLQLQLEFARYGRLVGHQRCKDLLNSQSADDIIQGRNIYKTFAEVVDYGEQYRGLQKLVGKGNESAGHVVKKYQNESWLDAHLSDCFCQVGGIWVNCMTDRNPSDIYIANGIEQWIRSPKLRQDDARPDSWNVFAYHHQPSEKSYLSDIFIFNATSGELMEVILGINYVQVSKLSMSKMLSRLTAGGAQSSLAAATISKPAVMEPSVQLPLKANIKPVKALKAPKPKKAKDQSNRPNILGKVKAILAELSGLEIEEIKDDSDLANIGIDSLMGMEMAREIESAFHCTLPEEELVQVTDLPGLLRCVSSAMGSTGDTSSQDDADETEDSDEEDQPSNNSSVFTPSPSNTSISSMGVPDLLEYLAEFLGLDRSEMTPGAVLRDFGVDSLLSTELRASMSEKFNLEFSDDLVIEEMTVEALDSKLNGSGHITSGAEPIATQSRNKPVSAPEVVQRMEEKHLAPKSGELELPGPTVLEAFNETKALTDQFIADYGCADYVESVLPKQTQMCISLTVETLEQLGCHLRSIPTGQRMERVKHLPQHGKLVDYLYGMLEKEAHLISIHGDVMTRTSTPVPTSSSREDLNLLLRSCPDHDGANKLTHYAGSNLAKVLTGETDGIKLIFGSNEGRELVSSLYGDWPLNKLYYKQMEDFLKRLTSKLPMHEGRPLKLLEMGAGTGGTTKWLVPLLGSLNVPVEYTFTDLAPSFVAAARKEFKKYPFLKFRTHDIEKAPADDLINSQHIVIASNAVHATHSLPSSTSNIRKMLRPDGLLMMLEMTGTLYWVDLVFGLFEGWWLFDDGRTHAVTSESGWETALQSVGYGHVDWTDGSRAENKVERFFIAMASGSRYERLSLPSKPAGSRSTDRAVRQAAVDEYVCKMVRGFPLPSMKSKSSGTSSPSGKCVLVTGGTGSLGSHLIAHLASQSNVQSIICLNRRSNQDPLLRQQQALLSKGISLHLEGFAKLQVFESDTAKPMLGLPQTTHEKLLMSVTHIIHNAWLMSAKRPLKGFEAQFQIMRNMIDLATEISCKRPAKDKVSFQFISSIATVGHYPLWSGNANVPEDRVSIDSVLDNGYGDAKYVCELMLDETLHKHCADNIRTMAVRIGQIAGSKSTGYWNPMEHLSFLWKSSQTLKALPDFDGLLSWTPVDDVAGTLCDLVLAENRPHPIYHIDNPVRQPWREMIPVLADALDIPRTHAIPFQEWVQRVRDFPALVESDNPAARLIDFLDENFLRMSCGGLLLETSKAREHSRTMREVTPVSEEVARKFVRAWKEIRFLT